MDSARAFCDLIIKPLEERRNQIRAKGNLTVGEKEILNKYDDIIMEKYIKLEKIIDKNSN